MVMIRTAGPVVNLAPTSFPKAHLAQVHCTNFLERLNREVNRRSGPASIFPNDKGVIRLAGAILMKQSNDWTRPAALHGRGKSRRPLR